MQEVAWPEHIYENFFVVVSRLLYARARLPLILYEAHFLQCEPVPYGICR